MIDIHCHILAEVDDGPKSWDTAQEMCRIAAADGIEHIVATPHANERYHYDREYLVHVLDYLRQRTGGAPKLSLGCDFHLSFTRLGEKGVTAVITHPERNPILQGTPQRILRWVELGCAVQVTASALTGAWGDRALRSAKWLLERDSVHVLASDAHDAKDRTPVLSAGRDAVAKICDADVAKALVNDNPRAIISGQPLPYFPDPMMKS